MRRTPGTPQRARERANAADGPFSAACYDCLDIYEAPDEQMAAKVSLVTLAMGASSAESWTLIPYDRYVKLTRAL